jgi:hypothetical protein
MAAQKVTAGTAKEGRLLPVHALAEVKAITRS